MSEVSDHAGNRFVRRHVTCKKQWGRANSAALTTGAYHQQNSGNRFLNNAFQHPAGTGRLEGKIRGALRTPSGQRCFGRSKGFTCAAVAPFSPKSQPSRARTGSRKGTPFAKEPSNRLPALSSPGRTGCGWCSRGARSTLGDCEERRGVNLTSKVPILVGEVSIDGRTPEESPGGFTWRKNAANAR